MDEPQAIASGTGRARVIPAALAATALVAAAVVWSYFSSFAYLTVWWNDSNYSHCWIIAPIALFILWQRREALASVPIRHAWWNFLPLLALLAARAWLFEVNERWAEAAMVPFVVAAMVLAIGGWGLLRWAMPALLYLIFLVPLPTMLNDKLAGPLQRIATLGSVEILKVLGQPVLAEGNVILIKSQHVEVAEACRGLSMLLSFGALITAMVILIRRPPWERVVLLLSIVPIALLCNIIRIAVTAIAYGWFDRPVHEVHDYAGFAMMALALGFVLIELKLMSWLVVEDQAPAGGPGPGSPGGLLRTSYGSNPVLR